MKNKKDEQGLNVLEMFGATETAVKEEPAHTHSEEEKPLNVPLVNDNSPQQQTPIAGSESYKAFGSNNAAQPQLEIRLRGNRGLWLYYPFITKSEYDGDESITLVCHGTSYIIRGKHLSKLRNHFRMQKIEYLQEFDPSQFKALPSPDMPLIEEIDIIETGGELEG